MRKRVTSKFSLLFVGAFSYTTPPPGSLTRMTHARCGFTNSRSK